MREVSNPWGTFHTWDQDLVGTTIATGVFWDQQIQPALDEADPTGWALDLGANIGWFTVYLARRHPHVVAVEAHPGTYQLLCENVALNGVADRVTGVEGAAYDVSWQALQIAPASWLGWAEQPGRDLDVIPNAASVAFVPPASSPILGRDLFVQSIAMDDWLDAHGSPRVSLVKVDCQGCDLRALVGLQLTLARDRPIVVFEFEGAASHWHGDHWSDYEAFFADQGYTITRIREDLWDYVARPQ